MRASTSAGSVSSVGGGGAVAAMARHVDAAGMQQRGCSTSRREARGRERNAAAVCASAKVLPGQRDGCSAMHFWGTPNLFHTQHTRMPCQQETALPHGAASLMPRSSSQQRANAFIGRRLQRRAASLWRAAASARAHVQRRISAAEGGADGVQGAGRKWCAVLQ
jgi:hypothetical protein